MTSAVAQIIDKYHGLASKQVINAVERAAARTGADFSFLMEKAAAESGFDPAARSKSSTATGLFQFIEGTWLQMVKEHGAKYGLGRLAARIEVKDGKPCVDDCAVKDEILNLRQNPEIAALMAGEFSAANKQYLETRTGGDVGAAELYLAHFMGAVGAAKFLNRRGHGGDVAAATLFPKEARANKNVFFDSGSARARTLDEIYDFFAQKFSGGDGNGEVASSLHPAPRHTGASRYPVSVKQDSGLRRNDGWGARIFDSVINNNSLSIAQNLPLAKLSVENILLLAQMRQYDS